jgi:hypothetical protein
MLGKYPILMVTAGVEGVAAFLADDPHAAANTPTTTAAATAAVRRLKTPFPTGRIDINT